MHDSIWGNFLTRSKFFYVGSITALILLLLLVLSKALPALAPIWLGCGIVMVVVFMALLAYGSSNLSFNYFIHSVSTLNTNPSESNHPARKSIALTFDDGPVAQSAQILDILKKHDIKATFFLIGERVQKNPQLARRMINEGHSIGNHSYQHGHLFNLKLTAGLRQEITQCNQTIYQHTGKNTSLFRAPHGVMTPHLAKAIQMTNMHSIGWNVRSFDTVITDPDKLLRKIMSQLSDNCVVLLHDYPEVTAKILPQLIENAHSQGYTFSVIDDESNNSDQ